MTANRSCVIIVENLPVPFDRRVWQEARALREAGWTVFVICPATRDYPALEETLDGVSIFRHPMPLEADGKLAYLVEYAAAIFHEFRLLVRIRRRTPISVIQGCNPPDLIFVAAAPFKLFGTRFVFDHHDICPELFAVKFSRKGLFYRALLVCEWFTFRLADHVISANETFRAIAIRRGGKKPEQVTAVYSIPDRSRMHRVAPNPLLRKGRRLVLGYVGIIGQQDGVDHLMYATRHLVNRLPPNELHTVVVGDGPSASRVRDLAHQLGIENEVTFTGYLRGNALLEALSTFDIGVIPDPANEYNDKISMNKVFEYTTLGIPTVAYRLTETMRLFGDAALYSPSDRPDGLADQIQRLVVDTNLRVMMAKRAHDRANELFDWATEARKYVEAFNGVAAGNRDRGQSSREASQSHV
jgi:glycosyltransferase involved in cell wall biosynthesis